MVGEAPQRTVNLIDAVASYDAGALALMAQGTQHTYSTWDRRLVAAYGDRDPATVTAGDLTDLIARHVLAARGEENRRRAGRSAEENAVGAFRHLWGYQEEKGYAASNVALRLSKPTRAEQRPARDPARRGCPDPALGPLRPGPAPRRGHYRAPRAARAAAH